jgi:hypothetical protein
LKPKGDRFRTSLVPQPGDDSVSTVHQGVPSPCCHSVINLQFSQAGEIEHTIGIGKVTVKRRDVFLEWHL